MNIKKLSGRTIQRTTLSNLGRDSSKSRMQEYGDQILEAIVKGQKPLESSSRYEIIEPLGEGGMGSVFLAEHVSAGDIRKRVAIKVIKDTHDEFALNNFIQEARICAQLSQGTIVELLALEHMELTIPGRRNPRTGGIEPKRKSKLYFMVMEFIDGPGFDHVLSQHKTHGVLMHPAIIGFILNKSAIALAEAHALVDDQGHPMGLVHRDISPSNILIAAKAGITKLADFGVAKAFQDFQGSVDEDTQVVGKPRYMAPEQLEGRAEAASDIWSLGVIAYEALTGYAPYRVQGDSLNAIVNNLRKQHLHKLRTPAEILRYRSNYYNIESFSELIMACLQQKPCDRPTSQEFIDAMESTFLYSQGLGPTNKTLAAYLKILDRVQDILEFPDSVELLESEEARVMRKVLRIKSVQHCFRKRTASMYSRDFLIALKNKEMNPCLYHGLIGPYEPDL